jgi:hypothetical protein
MYRSAQGILTKEEVSLLLPTHTETIVTLFTKQPFLCLLICLFVCLLLSIYQSVSLLLCLPALPASPACQPCLPALPICHPFVCPSDFLFIILPACLPARLPGPCTHWKFQNSLAQHMPKNCISYWKDSITEFVLSSRDAQSSALPVGLAPLA